MRGYLYILSNKAMPDLLKIGFTTRTIEERVKELNSTGVPSRFDIEFYCEVEHAKNFETEIHRKLRQYRFEKEFFKCQISKAVEVVKIVVSSGKHVFYGSGGRSASVFLTAEEQKEIIRLAEQNRLLAERKRIQEELLRQEEKAIESAIRKWEAIFILKTKEALEQAEKEYGKTLESIEKRGFISTTEDIKKNTYTLINLALWPTVLMPIALVGGLARALGAGDSLLVKGSGKLFDLVVFGDVLKLKTKQEIQRNELLAIRDRILNKLKTEHFNQYPDPKTERFNQYPYSKAEYFNQYPFSETYYLVLNEYGLYQSNNPLGTVVTELDLKKRLDEIDYTFETSCELEGTMGICALIYHPELFEYYENEETGML